jgi:large subunit ribosomal protein L4e
MFGPTKIWRKWHVKINTNQRRYAVVSALAASAVPALVLARGHRISNVPEIPLVVDNKAIDNIDKTKAAVALLKSLSAFPDIEKVVASKKLRVGKGKWRNRRYVQKKGPLIIFAEKTPMIRAFRNIPGVELLSVNHLNLLQLAPGGHLGRFLIWTKDAFEKLDRLFGTFSKYSTLKVHYKLPQPLVANPDLRRLLSSDEIQSVLKKAGVARRAPQFRRKNPLKNLQFLQKLNPAAKSFKRAALTAQARAIKKKAEKTAKRLAESAAATAQPKSKNQKRKAQLAKKVAKKKAKTEGATKEKKEEVATTEGAKKEKVKKPSTKAERIRRWRFSLHKE